MRTMLCALCDRPFTRATETPTAPHMCVVECRFPRAMWTPTTATAEHRASSPIRSARPGESPFASPRG